MPQLNQNVKFTKEYSWQIPPDLMPDKYELNISALDHDNKVIGSTTIPFTVVPVKPDYMVVLMWGGNNVSLLADTGFTHQLVAVSPVRGPLTASEIATKNELLDQSLASGIFVMDSISAKYRFLKAKKFLRVDRNGKPYLHEALEASHPDACSEFTEAVESTAKAFKHHPAFAGALLNSEIRDASRPSFSGVEQKAFRKFSGKDIPASVNNKYPMSYKVRSDFPWDRIVADNSDEMIYYRWFWSCGDGWNPLHTQLTEAYHRHIRRPFWTFYDPAVRVPPLWGSGGGADAISQWTYVYPDPIKIGQATDEVIAMAAGRKGQMVMSMTQTIAYRNQAAPIGAKIKTPPQWVKKEPNARYISLSPELLTAAIWSKISRRLDGIMFHGYGSLMEPSSGHPYRMTNTKVRAALKKILHEVITPLGPILKRIPERVPECGIYQSFTSTLYTGRHSFGWSRGWYADLHLALQWANIQPGIFYREHLENKLIDPKKTRVLFLAGVEVVSQKELALLQEYQRQGGIIVGDEYTTPALMVDWRIRSVSRRLADPVGTKKELQKLGNLLRNDLKKYIRPAVSATNADLVVRRRGNNSSDYIFVVNDKRTFGSYIGQYGMVQEQGLPNSGTISVANSATAAYDLVKHQEIPLKRNGQTVSFDVSLSPGGGSLVWLTKGKIADLTSSFSATVKTGEAWHGTIEIKDEQGQLIRGYCPIQLILRSSDGKELPGSGFYAVENGTLKVSEIVPINCKQGNASFVIRCLATGKSKSEVIAIK